MKSTYLDYLNSLSKEQLIELIYIPYMKRGSYPPASKRTIALRLSYNGERYKGVQHHKHLRTVYDCLQNALKTTEIGDNIVFCGRTDAGVSAINMIVSAEMNSRILNPNRSFRVTDEDYNEYPYDVILNMLLPDDVRITGWAPVPDGFNARFDCIQRHYKYFFILNDMKLDKMKEAMDIIREMDDFYLLSSHTNPKAIYKRTIDSININKVELRKSTMIETNIFDNKIESDDMQLIENISDGSDDLYCLDIKASGFLHNMVRKIFWVIQNSGKGNLFTLKNVEIADSAPLVFVGAKYKEKLNFIGNRYNKMQFKKETDISKIKAAISQLRFDEFD